MLTIIDLSSIFWQTWHATGDQEVGAAHAATMAKIAKYNTGDLRVATDSPPYDRSKLYPGYKAQREKASELAVSQLDRVKRDLAASGVRVFFSTGNEADDVIATLIREINPPEVNVVTGDKDLAQLCARKGVTITSTQTGLVMDAEGVAIKFGVTPEQIPDLLALMGDKSDNVPGAPGVGIKLGGDLLRKFKTARNLLDVAASGDPDNEISPPKIRESIIVNIDKIDMALRLVTLKSDCKLERFLPCDDKPIIDVEFEEDDPEPSPSAKTPDSAEEARTTTAPEQESTAISVRQTDWLRQLEPSNTGNVWKLAQVLYNSRLYTKFSNPEAIAAVILHGRSFGLNATTSLDSFHVVEGKPTMSAALIVGLVLGSGKAKYLYEVDSTPTSSTWATWRIGNPAEQRKTFTIDLANQIGLGHSAKGAKTQWQKDPENMLSWRCATKLSRKVYPDVVGGLYTPDEIEVA